MTSTARDTEGYTSADLPAQGAKSVGDEFAEVGKAFTDEMAARWVELRPIKSREELVEYIGADLMQCLVCGRRFAFLANHLRRRHGVSSKEYRADWGLPASTPLAGVKFRKARSVLAHRLIAEGKLDPCTALASEIARAAGRGYRVDWERAEQAARAAAIRHPELPPGAKRADGRDADHAREYQREYRRAKRDRALHSMGATSPACSGGYADSAKAPVPVPPKR